MEKEIESWVEGGQTGCKGEKKRNGEMKERAELAKTSREVEGVEMYVQITVKEESG